MNKFWLIVVFSFFCFNSYSQNAINVVKIEELKKVYSNADDTTYVINFFATWCGPCQALAPILKQVKDSLGDRITIVKIDVDKNQQMAAQYQVRGVPTMILFQAGRQLWRQSGVVSKEEIIKTILEKSN